jgi:hypothetical protein
VTPPGFPGAITARAFVGGPRTLRQIIYRVEVDGSVLNERTVSADDPKARHEAIRLAAAHAALGREAAVYRLSRGPGSRAALIYFAPRTRDR